MKLTKYHNRPTDATPVRKAYEGTDLLLLCRVDAFPSPTISVGKNGEGIVPSERVSIEMNSTEYKEDDLGGDSIEFKKFNFPEFKLLTIESLASFRHGCPNLT